MSVVKTQGLSKVFGDFKALDGVDIEVKSGEVFGFIGPNGAGKSTTLRVLLGILKPSEGSAEIFGKDVWRDAVEIHKRVAYVPGDVNLWSNLTGGEVIDLFARLHGGYDKVRRDELIARFGLDPSKKCRTYSKGNRQKVALIAAFSADADLYIFDEPTSGLDPLMERVFADYVHEAKAQRKSIVLSSHILSEVEKLCDRVAIIRKGRIIETGTLKEMRHLTGSLMFIETEKPIADLAGLPGVHRVQAFDGGWSFQVDADELDAVVRHLSAYGIKRMESRPPTLEDLFIRHYEETETGAGGEA